MNIKKELLYEGKAKKVFATSNPNEVIVEFKDDITAFNKQKQSQIAGKGEINNQITAIIFTYLAEKGLSTHFKKVISSNDQLCTKVSIFPIEVIVRNLVAGSLAKRLDIKEGTEVKHPIFELSYKNDRLGDPLLTDSHATAVGLVSKEILAKIYESAAKVNKYLSELLAKSNILLVDFKIEYGQDNNGNLLLADEISPDTCRFWDKDTHYKLDKDRFRKSLGKEFAAYQEILNRLTKQN
ncbi:MAG: phosphoribosylaminoimidazolesuccinocarboxamide synthase [SAR324 cluster bacterium]|nr:phosphoribosylaminoimidazolesuccinocarboxamide synthase [SAR324 cluster bacterium]